ncbi:MAG: SOS response-associated peptidase [Leucobacter sp.]|jgi:putative SOS response-associated peptidase YedK|nr:SOS response-associated peptidase [Leucobacter sp.]
MCASYGLTFQDAYGLDPLDGRESRALLDEWLQRHRGAAKITGCIAVNLNPLIVADAASARTLKLGWWWLWRDSTGPVQFSAFNSRDDKLTRSWAGPLQRRALLPASWYVEKKVRFGLPDNGTFAIAAITNTVVDARTGEQRLSYSMVTREALGEAAATWNRMPLVLPADMHDTWLDPERTGDAQLVSEAQHASNEISAAMCRSDDENDDGESGAPDAS